MRSLYIEVLQLLYIFKPSIQISTTLDVWGYTKSTFEAIQNQHQPFIIEYIIHILHNTLYKKKIKKKKFYTIPILIYTKITVWSLKWLSLIIIFETKLLNSSYFNRLNFLIFFFLGSIIIYIYIIIFEQPIIY